MAKKVTILRGSLLSLALAAAIPAAWAADGAPKVLDLKVPDIHAVMTSDQIAAATPNSDETEVIEPETVQVHGGTPPPYVPGGFAALYWGAMHPSEAWRILTPVQ